VFCHPLRGWLAISCHGGVQGNGHRSVTIQQLAPEQCDLGRSLAFASQPEAVGIESNGVVGAIDRDLSLELLVENGCHWEEYFHA
jgi:hypothetical protein